MKRTHLVAALLVGLVAAPLGCAHTTEKVVRSSVTGGLKGTLEALNDPHNQELLRRLLQDTDVKRAAHDLTAAVTGGAVDGLTDEERVARVQKASDDYIRTVAAAVGKALDEDLSPAAARAVEGISGGAVAGALSPANARLARNMLDGVTRSTVTAFTQSTAQGLRDDLGPAVQKVLAEDLGPTLQRVVEDNLGPALRKVIEKDLQPAMQAALGGGMTGEDAGGAGLFARALTKQIVLGVNDGMSEMGISPAPNKKDGGGLLTGWLPIVLALLLLLLTVAVVRMYLTRRALMRDRIRNDEMLVHILQAIKTNESTPGAPSSLDDVLARVQQRMPGLDADNPYFATIVGRAQLPNRAPAAQVPKLDEYKSARPDKDVKA